jgi:hypothetical protein
MPPFTTEELLSKVILELTEAREQIVALHEQNAALQVKFLGELGDVRNEVVQLKQTATDQHNLIFELLRQVQSALIVPHQSTITPPSHQAPSVHHDSSASPHSVLDHHCTQKKQGTPNTSKLKDGEWNCSQCYIKNTSSQIICVCRQSTKPGSEQLQHKASDFAKNVFHDTILRGLYLSPEAFIYRDTPSTNTTPRSFRWSIEHQSIMNPANIDESRVHEQNSSLFETADNHRIQQITSNYFKTCNFPSPIHSLQIPQTRPRHFFSSPSILRDQPMESSP